MEVIFLKSQLTPALSRWNQNKAKSTRNLNRFFTILWILVTILRPLFRKCVGPGPGYIVSASVIILIESFNSVLGRGFSLSLSLAKYLKALLVSQGIEPYPGPQVRNPGLIGPLLIRVFSFIYNGGAIAQWLKHWLGHSASGTPVQIPTWPIFFY